MAETATIANVKRTGRKDGTKKKVGVQVRKTPPFESINADKHIGRTPVAIASVTCSMCGLYAYLVGGVCSHCRLVPSRAAVYRPLLRRIAEWVTAKLAAVFVK